MRKIFLAIAALMSVDVLAQLYLAGVGAFNIGGRGATFDDGFALHATNGRMIMPAVALLLVLAAALARAGRSTVWLAVVNLVLIAFVQSFTILVPMMLAGSTLDRMSDAAVWGAAIHPVTGLAIIILSNVVLTRAVRLVRQGRATTTPRRPRATAPASVPPDH